MSSGTYSFGPMGASSSDASKVNAAAARGASSRRSKLVDIRRGALAAGNDAQFHRRGGVRVVALERHLLELGRGDASLEIRRRRLRRRARSAAVAKSSSSSARRRPVFRALGDRLRLGRKNVRVFRGGADGLVVRVGIGGRALPHRIASSFERASGGFGGVGGVGHFGEALRVELGHPRARRSAASHRLQFRRGGVFILVAGDIVRPGVAFGVCGGGGASSASERAEANSDAAASADSMMAVSVSTSAGAASSTLVGSSSVGGAISAAVPSTGVCGGEEWRGRRSDVVLRPLRATRRGGVQIRGDVRRVPALFRGARRRRATKLRREGRRERVGREAGAGTANPVVRGRVRPRSPRDFPKTEEDLRQREARFRRDRGRTSSSPMARSRVRRRYSSRLRIAPLVHTPTPDRRGAVRRRRGA